MSSTVSIEWITLLMGVGWIARGDMGSTILGFMCFFFSLIWCWQDRSRSREADDG